MHRYVKISGVLFALIAVAQLTRSILGLPAQVGGMAIPIWCSIAASMVTSGLAIWAFRVSRGAV